MRVGILGGTFDPIHIGHLIAASEVHTQLSLDTVIFLPAGNPWQKSDSEVTPPTTRFEMVQQAINDDSRFEISDLEIRRDGPSYAIDTVRQWQQLHPQDDVYWIMGADVLANLHTWHRWEEFVAEVKIVCVNRPGNPIVEVPFEVINVTIPDVHVSATELRERFATGVPNSYLVPQSVIDYVAQHEVYQP